MLLQAWRSISEPYRGHMMAILRWAQEAMAFSEAHAVYERVRVAVPGAAALPQPIGEGPTPAPSVPRAARRRAVR